MLLVDGCGRPRYKHFFGFRTFRPFQKEVIQKLLGGQDCLVVMATGSGKSLCYQLPPLISKKCAIVISPLISLMQDQVMGLKQRGINSEYLGSSQSDRSVIIKARQGHYDILFLTPEKAMGLPDSFWKDLTNKGVSLLAVDEAHCISEWGHDFRKDYQQLQKLRRVLPQTPMVALTATATERVRIDIKKSLNLTNVYEVVSTFDRPNLFYGVKFINRTHAFREELAQEVMKDCQSGGSTIIYCTTVKDVEEVTEALTLSGVAACSYHAQMNQKDRLSAHSAFSRDELQIIVATVAFGMGIDKPDIRRVIHYGCPKSLECYYQESGRCGRDGLPSSCWLYYTRSDFSKGDFYAAEAQTEARRKVIFDVYQAAERYCKASACRRKFILQYFGEMVSFENCGNCDNCTTSKSVEERDLSEETHLLLSSVDLCGGRFGINLPIEVLRGSRSKKILEYKFDELPLYGLGSSKTSNWWKALGDELLSNGYLTETRRDMYRFISVGALGKRFLQSASSKRVPVMIIPTQEMLEEESKRGGLSINEGLTSHKHQETTSKYSLQLMSEPEVKLCEFLLKERANIAKRNNTAPYAICSELTIQNLARVRPSSRARLLNVDGVNQWLVGKHGDEIFKAIKQLSTELGLTLDSAEKSQMESQTVPNSTRQTQGAESKATPAKIEAWRMWQEEGMTLSEIANLPDRPKPIKEETVGEYIVECCRLGFELNWQRFSKETGFDKVVKEVQAGVERVGSKDRLKPIKEQVPEHVSYLHIRMFLMMQELELPDPSISTKESNPESLPDHEEPSSQAECIVRESFDDEKATNGNRACEELHTETSQKNAELPWSDENSSVPSRQKRAPMWMRDSDRYTKWSRKQELTEECLMEWLSEKKNGVTIQAMLAAFSTDKDSLLALLTKLEEDFLIYKRNDLYRII
ncbi:hypothetical protein GOP47_0002425 [Adiantum capillus-veneris]|uniref:ATP-dependent DNA helicase n=1 Tax=Adiantum capillus-veneris TaxID=13818 RepID=A0A9D4VAN3_ADICA|nr:hypothetical protein GOP47_0002425 [Adiantum capillus-veneris]